MISKQIQPEVLTRRPEAEEGFEKQKKVIFGSVLKEMHREAEGTRRFIEKHVMQTLGRKLPTRDGWSTTVTYDDLE
jgi:hypothetical protein